LSLIQIPKIDYIILDRFIPKWTKYSKELVFEGEAKPAPELDLYESRQCLVGEARGFGSSYHPYSGYGCDVCWKKCDEACQLFDCKNYKQFENFKLDLFTHMLEAHSELMIK